LSYATTDTTNGLSLANQVTTLKAQVTSTPNLIKNGDFSNGLTGWNAEAGPSTTGYSSQLGSYIAVGGGTAYAYATSDAYPCTPGDNISISFDGDCGQDITAGVPSVNIQWLPSYTNGSLAYANTSRDWRTRNSAPAQVAPSGTTGYRVVVFKPASTTASTFYASRIKVNYGPPSGWSDEGLAATVSANATAFSTLSGQVYASYVLKANANGNIASMSLLASGGATPVSSVVFEAANFTIRSGTNPSLQPFSYDATSGTLTLQNAHVTGNLIVDGTITGPKLGTAAVGSEWHSEYNPTYTSGGVTYQVSGLHNLSASGTSQEFAYISGAFSGNPLEIEVYLEGSAGAMAPFCIILDGTVSSGAVSGGTNLTGSIAFGNGGAVRYLSTTNSGSPSPFYAGRYKLFYAPSAGTHRLSLVLLQGDASTYVGRRWIHVRDYQASSSMPDLNTTNAALAQQLSTLATNWNANQNQFANWQAGTLTGGTAANGTGTGPYYPLTNAVGTVGYFLCPAGIAANSLPLTGGALASSTGGGAATATPATLKVQAGALGTALNNDINIGGFLAGSTNNSYLNVHLRRTLAGGTDWTSAAMGLSYDVDSTVGAGGQLWFSNGRIGIGTATPGYALDVNGTVNASALVTPGNAVISGAVTANGNGIFGGVNIGSVSTGYYGDATNLALRAPSSGGAVYVQSPSGAATWATLNSAGLTLNGNLAAVGQSNSDTGNGYSATSSFALVGAGGSNWYASNVASRSYSAVHLDSRIGSLVVSQTVGSTGTPSSPATADYAGGLISVKVNWLSSTVAGEVDGDICYVRQGINGDCAGRLTNIGKMGTSGGILAHEATVSTLAVDPSYPTDPSKALRLISIQSAQGFVETGGEAMGFWAEKRTGSGGTAFKSRCYDDRTAAEIANGVTAPTWDNHFSGWNSRSQAYEAVRIDNLGNYFHTRYQTVGGRKTGWGAPSGTLNRAAYSSYAGQTVSNPPTQAQMQALDDAVALLSKTVAALLTDLYSASALDAQSTTGHGLIGP
ncbi:Hypothetical predicted protein, partial [Olea europaea subsp. europaea]